MRTTQDRLPGLPDDLQAAALEAVAQLVDGPQACKILGIHRTTIYDLVRRRSLRSYRIGAVTVFFRPEVERLRDARKAWAGGQE